MSSANSTANYLKATKFEEKLQSTLSHDTRAVDEEKSIGEDNNEQIPLITDEEIQAAINKLKKGKASDNKGIRAEVIKACDLLCTRLDQIQSEDQGGFPRSYQATDHLATRQLTS